MQIVTSITEYFNKFMTFARIFILLCYDTFIGGPMYNLYRHGPAFHGYGFWRGKSNSYICSYLTNYDGVTDTGVGVSTIVNDYVQPDSLLKPQTLDSSFWIIHSRECEIIISRDFKQYEIMILTVIYVYVLIRILEILFLVVKNNLLTCKCTSSCCKRPLLQTSDAQCASLVKLSTTA